MLQVSRRLGRFESAVPICDESILETGSPQSRTFSPLTICPNSTLRETQLTFAAYMCFVSQRSSNPGATLISVVGDTQVIRGYMVWARIAAIDVIDL